MQIDQYTNEQLTESVLMDSGLGSLYREGERIDKLISKHVLLGTNLDYWFDRRSLVITEIQRRHLQQSERIDQRQGV
jgi:lipopolysaccharide biosynthesis regulator YciM